jgi:probable rRNA maturation factor
LIDFTVEDGLSAEWDEARMTQLVDTIVSRELGVPEYLISLHLVCEDAIQSLNARHRGKDFPTDVLSFPLLSSDFVTPPNEPVDLGDVVVSYPRAVSQANEYGHSVDRELAYLVAHGVLHVLGYDHEEEPERLRMRHKEEEALGPLGFTR